MASFRDSFVSSGLDGHRNYSVPLGTEENPAESAQELYDGGYHTDGFYWIQHASFNNGTAFEVYCDMNEDGVNNVVDVVLLVNLVLYGSQEDCDVELWDDCYNIENTTSLNLSQNGLTGEIPPEIGSLINLTYLNLGYNAFSVGIPPAHVWHVSRQSPTFKWPMTSQSLSIESMYLATEFFPPAVFSTNTLIPVSSTCSIAFLQFS